MKPLFFTPSLLRAIVPLLFSLFLSQAAQAVTYTQSTVYDDSNGSVTQADPDGNTLQYQSDLINRLTGISVNGEASPRYSYAYDLTDQLIRQTYPGGSQDYTYDEFDRLKTLSDFGQSNLLAFDYDPRDRLTWITYPGNGNACYQYDADGRLLKVGRFHTPVSNVNTPCSAADEQTDYGYEAQGRQSTLTYPNGIQRRYRYDTATGQLNTVTTQKANGSLILQEDYRYWPGSSLYKSVRQTTAAAVKTTHYRYDAYQRLTDVIESDGRKTVYQYDAFGNRTQETLQNLNDPQAIAQAGSKAYGVYDYIYPTNSNRLQSIQYNGAVQQSFLYDNSGRITQRTKNGNTTLYTWNALGQLMGVNPQTGSTGPIITYTYDGLGVRKSKTVTDAQTPGGVTTQYLTANLFGYSHVLAELAPDLTIKATYLYAGNAILKQEPSVSDRSQDLYLLNSGTVGSITHTISPTGQIKHQTDYDAFGSPSGSPISHYGYTGEETDTETALIYLRARYYDPDLGRFISADPYWGRLEDPISQNRFIYVHNNPISNVDPSGLATTITLQEGEGVNIFDHIGIGTTSGQNANITFGAGPNPGNSSDVIKLLTVPGHVQPDTNNVLKTLIIQTTPSQEQRINAFNENAVKTTHSYKLIGGSCVNHVVDAFSASGISLSFDKIPITPSGLFDAFSSLGVVKEE